MMFEYAFKLYDEGKAIREAVAESLKQGIVTEDIAGNGKAYGTDQVGDFIKQQILK